MKEAHPDYDLIVIGGGCAGLSLARRLIEDESTLRVLILEHRDAYSDDRAWCFWENSDHSLKNLEAKTWATWQCSCADDAISPIGRIAISPTDVLDQSHSINTFRITSTSRLICR